MDDIDINDATRRFIIDHREDDVDDVALRCSGTAGVDMPLALRQIDGWQRARRKLPSWALSDTIVYPPRRAMEQCSGENAAVWKAKIVDRLMKDAARRRLMIDLTGGAGADFAILSRLFGEAVYVEKDACLCRLAEHNMAVLGINNARFVCSDAVSYVQNAVAGDAVTAGQTSETRQMASLIFIDPSRRDDIGRRQTAISDCQPDVIPMVKTLLQMSEMVMIKLSPMLDVHKSIADLNTAAGTNAVREVHVVAFDNECKELLVVLAARQQAPLTIVCANDGMAFAYRQEEQTAALRQTDASVPTIERGMWLYEPFTPLLKAGCFALLSRRFGVAQIDNNSHLFVSSAMVNGFPGRCFRIVDVVTMNRRDLRDAFRNISRANVAVRNFPLSAAELSRRLHVSDGGDVYVFGTTVARRHIIIVANKSSADQKEPI